MCFFISSACPAEKTFPKKLNIELGHSPEAFATPGLHQDQHMSQGPARIIDYHYGSEHPDTKTSLSL